MGMFDSISFSAPDFNMGDDNGKMMKKFLRRKDQDRMREEDQQRQEQFQAGLSNFRKQNEMRNVSKVMNPTNQQTQTPNNVRFAPYNPGLDEFRRDQTQLGRDKLNLAKEKQENQANLANRGMDVRERLAKLKDMPDSERFKLLQEGKIDLAEYNAAKSMERVVKQGEIRSDQITQQGDIRSGQITQQGEIRANQIIKQGDITSGNITKRGDEARKTKGTPSYTTQQPTQQKVALQGKVSELVSQHPEWSDYIKFNDQGFPVITMPDTHWGPGSSPDDKVLYDNIYNSIYGSPNAAQPPPPQPPPQEAPPQQPNTGMPTNKYGVMQKTGMFKPGMEEEQPSQTQASQGVMKQYSPSRNQTRISTDGGRTWKIVEGKQ